jgi:hypothetical protein
LGEGAIAQERGFSFFSFHKANNETPETLTTLKRTPGISPIYRNLNGINLLFQKDGGLQRDPYDRIQQSKLHRFPR